MAVSTEATRSRTHVALISSNGVRHIFSLYGRINNEVTPLLPNVLHKYVLKVMFVDLPFCYCYSAL